MKTLLMPIQHQNFYRLHWRWRCQSKQNAIRVPFLPTRHLKQSILSQIHLFTCMPLKQNWDLSHQRSIQSIILPLSDVFLHGWINAMLHALPTKSCFPGAIEIFEQVSQHIICMLVMLPLQMDMGIQWIWNRYHTFWLFCQQRRWWQYLPSMKTAMENLQSIFGLI
jgi:hypothetical protein